MRSRRGITLMALVLTIIVMATMTGISMNAIFGENGIIKNAQNSKIQKNV